MKVPVKNSALGICPLKHAGEGQQYKEVMAAKTVPTLCPDFLSYFLHFQVTWRSLFSLVFVETLFRRVGWS